jgi:hypothetical protein
MEFKTARQTLHELVLGSRSDRGKIPVDSPKVTLQCSTASITHDRVGFIHLIVVAVGRVEDCKGLRKIRERKGQQQPIKKSKIKLMNTNKQHLCEL